MRREGSEEKIARANVLSNISILEFAARNSPSQGA
jgi:hypothetical protein